MYMDIDISSLSDLEYHIYSYIFSNAKRVTYMSIQELAKETNTSTASIMRFCKHAHCNGFSEFKYRLREEMESSSPNRGWIITGDNLGELQKFFNTYVVSQAFQQAIDKAAEILKKKKVVIFAGLGASNIISSYASYYFTYLFGLSFHVVSIMDFPLIYVPPELSKDTCIVALSISGETQEVVNYVRNFKNCNSNMILITCNDRSTLAKLADVTISYPMPLTYKGEANLTSQVPAVYVIERLGKRVEELSSPSK
jgi:DNA-binding MurR/RpiR family transcriptional regulator